mgnify:CR=1 FL=1
MDPGPLVPELVVGADRVGRVDASGPVAIEATLERPGTNSTSRAHGRRARAEADDLARELADPGLLLARQLADVLLDEVDPAAGDRADVVVSGSSRPR